MKNIIIYLIFLIPWFLGGLIFGYDKDFYLSLNLSNISLPIWSFSIIWTIIYILIAYSIYLSFKKHDIFSKRDYLYILLTNYLANSTFPFFFFSLRSPFLGFVSSVIILVSSIYLYLETKHINKKASYFLIFYVIFNIYATISSLIIYLMNF